MKNKPTKGGDKMSPPLTKAQDRRFKNWHNRCTRCWDCGEPEANKYKKFISRELAIQKKEIIEELEKMRAVATMDDMSENRWIEGKSRNETLDQAISVIKKI